MKDHFDLLAPFYERFIHPREPVDLAGFAGLPTEGILLDAGGGTGRITQFLTGQAGGIVVADLSHDMLREATQKPGLLAVRSHSERLPFPENTFASIIMVDALHHVCNQSLTAADLFRVLKPGGTLVIEEPDIRKFVIKLIAVAEKLALMRSHFLDPDQITALFKQPDAKVEIKTGDTTAWVIVKKEGGESAPEC